MRIGWPLFFAGTALWITGQIERASRYASDMLRQAERLGNRGLLANALLQSGTVCHVKGEWDKAREFYDRGMVVAPHWYMIIGFKLQLEYELGEFEAAGDYMKRLLEIVRDTPPGPTGEISYAAMLPPFAARITGNATRFDITLDAAETVLLSPSVTPMLASDVRVGLALIAVIESNAAAAMEQYEVLQSSRGTMLPNLISADRILGLLALTMDDVGKAATHFEDSMGFCRKAGYLPELAWSLHDYALLPRGQVDMQQALKLLEEALAISSDLGMGPLKARVTALKEQIESRPAGRPRFAGGLTRREVEVLGLITAGKTNQEIAEELVISLSTVANHVTSLLNKTGSANRAEATAYAVRHGLA